MDEYVMDEDEMEEYNSVQKCTDLTFFQGWAAARVRMAATDGHAQLLSLLLEKMPHVCIPRLHDGEENQDILQLTVSVPDSQRKTALMKAVQGGHVTCVGVILEHIRTMGEGAKFVVDMCSGRFPKENALTMACKGNHLEIVKLLLSHGADPDALPHCTALHEAKFHPECFVEIAKVSRIFDELGTTPEAWAFRHDATKLLRHMLEQKKDSDAFVWFYQMLKTQIDEHRPSKSMVRQLFQHACKVGAVAAVNIMLQTFTIPGQILFNGAVRAIYGFHLVVVQSLHKHFNNPQRNMLFHRAIGANSTPIVMWLIAMGVNEHASWFSQPALCHAATCHADKVVGLFLQRGGGHLNETLLRRALRRALFGNFGNPHFEIADMLRDAGALCSASTVVHHLAQNIVRLGDDALPMLEHLHARELRQGGGALTQCRAHRLLIAALRSESNVANTVRYIVDRMNAPLAHALDIAAERYLYARDCIAIISFLVDHGATFAHGAMPPNVYYMPAILAILDKMPDLPVRPTFFAETIIPPVRREVIAHLITRPHLWDGGGVHFEELLHEDEMEAALLKANSDALREAMEEPTLTREDIQAIRKAPFPSGMKGLTQLQRLTFALSHISPQRYAEQGYLEGEWKSASQILDDLLAAFMYRDVKTQELGKRKRVSFP